MKLPKELVAASASPVVLSLLAGGESYGYAILQRVKELSGGEVTWTDGMLYPVLHRLERQKLILSRWGKSDTGRKRKYYRLSKKGTRALTREREEWRTVHGLLEKLWEHPSCPDMSKHWTLGASA